jgi:hypothetical protein
LGFHPRLRDFLLGYNWECSSNLFLYLFAPYHFSDFGFISFCQRKDYLFLISLKILSLNSKSLTSRCCTLEKNFLFGLALTAPSYFLYTGSMTIISARLNPSWIHCWILITPSSQAFVNLLETTTLLSVRSSSKIVVQVVWSHLVLTTLSRMLSCSSIKSLLSFCNSYYYISSELL